METQRRFSPRFQILQRRVSPRFQNLRNGGNSNIRKTRNASESRKTSNTKVSPRGGNSNIGKIQNASESRKPSSTRVSPRFQNLLIGDNSNIGKIWNASESCKTSNTRVNSRVRNLPNVVNSNIEKICNSIDSGKTSNTRVSPNSKIEKMCNATNSTETSNTRVSPSFQNLPDVEIWDAADSRKTSNTRVSPRFQSLLNCGDSNTEKIQNVLDSRKISDMRVSPRLQSIPLEKRPYYGSCRKRKTLNDSPSNSNIEKIVCVLDSRKTSSTRVSPRFQSIPLEKRPYYGSCQKRKTLEASQDTLMVKKYKVGNAELECVSNGSVTVENGEKDGAHLRETGTKGGNSGDDIASIHGTTAAMVVKDKLRLFNKYFLHFSKKEYERCNGVNGSASDHEIVNGETHDKEDACEGNVKKSMCQGHFKLSKCKGCAKQSKIRPDLMAISEMLKKNEVLCHERYFGHLPGIEVGHCFYFRAEMVAVGLHKLLLKGIDYIGSPYVKSEYSDYTFPLAGAIVLSGQYEDDFDSSEEIVYTGEGGNGLHDDKHQIKDQVMLRGNLALKNNKEQSVPVKSYSWS